MGFFCGVRFSGSAFFSLNIGSGHITRIKKWFGLSTNLGVFDGVSFYWAKIMVMTEHDGISGEVLRIIERLWGPLKTQI